MPSYLRQETSSGTTPLVPLLLGPDSSVVKAEAWNTAPIAFVIPTEEAERSSLRPLSAIAEMAVDLGPPDLSSRFRANRST